MADLRHARRSQIAEGKIKHRYAVRIQTVVNRAAGRPASDTAAFPGININTVSGRVNRYNEDGIESLLKDRTRPPGIAPISGELKNETAEAACKEKPETAAHRSTRDLAKRFGISHTAVHAILPERGIKPHPVRKFNPSTDKEFGQKPKDAAGLCSDPPENSTVFCAGEKTQIQALERTRPILPPRPGIPERHGTTVLFAAPNAAGGKVTGNRKRRHTPEDYADFLKLPGRKTAKGRVPHIIADNVPSRKAEPVKKYLKRKGSRFVGHFIPIYGLTPV
ncbi:MAG: IS630 family transposase [Treponematales bacterium]